MARTGSIFDLVCHSFGQYAYFGNSVALGSLFFGFVRLVDLADYQCARSATAIEIMPPTLTANAAVLR